MFPEADIPVAQLSLSSLQPGAWHYDLARNLAPLRDEGVLVVASGNIVHNLRYWRQGQTEPLDWAQRFDEDIAERHQARLTLSSPPAGHDRPPAPASPEVPDARPLPRRARRRQPRHCAASFLGQLEHAAVRVSAHRMVEEAAPHVVGALRPALNQACQPGRA